MGSAGIDELFARTLDGGYEDDGPWDAVCELRHMGTREVFEKAAEWAGSGEPLKRARGIDVLAQLGKFAEPHVNSFPEESYEVVRRAMEREREFQPLNSAIAALGHLDDARGIPLIAALRAHPDAEIRYSVACALGSFADDDLSVETLRGLMEDADDNVRDLATFGLGVLGGRDSAEIRDSLFRRLGDPFEDAREEALVGLAKRHDARSVGAVIEAMEAGEVSGRVVRAAYTLLGMDEDREDWSRADYVAALRADSTSATLWGGTLNH